jgi:hypothetical protein
MARFANAEAQWRSLDFLWLAGLLEAEGTFLRPPPSSPRSPIVVCRMTDRDVIERVADRFGTAVFAVDKGEYKTEYGAAAKGSRAAALMRDLRPFMSERRQVAIDHALDLYVPPDYKLSYELAEKIRERHAAGETVSSLARSFGVARQTIHPILKREIYWAPRPRPWRDPRHRLPEPADVPEGFSPDELYWLAGWLEGEGSFVAPPPSSPRLPRVAFDSCDRDVVEEAARLLRVAVSKKGDARTKQRGWSTVWRGLSNGGRAVTLMRAIHPMVSQRRSGQITHALDAAELAEIRGLRRPYDGRGKMEAAGVAPASVVS